jgi:hypothetical protein
VSLSELDSHGCELRICSGSMNVLCGDIAVIWGTRRSDLFEIVGTEESMFTVVPAGTPTCRVIEGNDMNIAVEL